MPDILRKAVRICHFLTIKDGYKDHRKDKTLPYNIQEHLSQECDRCSFYDKVSQNCDTLQEIEKYHSETSSAAESLMKSSISLFLYQVFASLGSDPAAPVCVRHQIRFSSSFHPAC